MLKNEAIKTFKAQSELSPELQAQLTGIPDEKYINKLGKYNEFRNFIIGEISKDDSALDHKTISAAINKLIKKISTSENYYMFFTTSSSNPLLQALQKLQSAFDNYCQNITTQNSQKL